MHWMDRVQIWALKRGICFQDGWGDLSHAEPIAAALREPPPILPIEPVFGPPTTVLGAELRVGHFESPDDRLPEETRSARVWWLHPSDQPVRGAVVMFASWGDEGPTMRGRIVGPLVREGVSIAILENPFYGCRRREGQRAQGLRTVSDFILMQGAAGQEGRSLIQWLRRQIDGPVAAVGFSMGGHLASVITGSLPGSVPLVAAAPPLCPSEPFTVGPLGRCIDWEALGGANADTFARWAELMDLYDVRHVASPARPELVRLIGCSMDGLVPPKHSEVLADSWRVPLAWEPIGHVGIAIARSRVMRSAIREVLGIPARGRRPAIAERPVEATVEVPTQR